MTLSTSNQSNVANDFQNDDQAQTSNTLLISRDGVAKPSDAQSDTNGRGTFRLRSYLPNAYASSRKPDRRNGRYA